MSSSQGPAGVEILRQGKDFIGKTAVWLINTLAKNPRALSWWFLISIVVFIIMIIVIIVLAYKLKKGSFYVGGSSNLTTGSNNPLWFQGGMDAGKGGNLDRNPTAIQMGMYDPVLRQMTEPWRYDKKTTDFTSVNTNFNDSAIPEAVLHGELGQSINELDILGSGQIMRNGMTLDEISKKIQDVQAF
jgi:hypothetical protein